MQRFQSPRLLVNGVGRQTNKHTNKHTAKHR